MMVRVTNIIHGAGKLEKMMSCRGRGKLRPLAYPFLYNIVWQMMKFGYI